jgi:hypothetical protein
MTEEIKYLNKTFEELLELEGFQWTHEFLEDYLAELFGKEAVLRFNLEFKEGRYTREEIKKIAEEYKVLEKGKKNE